MPLGPLRPGIVGPMGGGDRTGAEAGRPLAARVADRLGEPWSRRIAATALFSVGVASTWWHATVLAGSPQAPVTALLGTGLLLVVSLLVAAAGGGLVVADVDADTAVRIGGWVALMMAAFGAVGVLVSLHLDFMLSGFDGGPLIADLLTLGAAVGFLVGEYDARSRRYQAAMHEERDRFASLFDNLPNPAVRYRQEDGEAVVLDANDAFEDVFGFDVMEARGKTLETLVVPDGGASEAEAASNSERPAVSARASERRQMTSTGLRDFQVITVPYRGNEGFTIWIDVTERKLQIRRLEVLNRVLRHDLRTDANIIAGNAELLSDSPEAEAIHDRALALAERGEAARRVEQALDRTTERHSVDLTALVERKASELDDATVHTDLDEALVYGSNALETVLDELFENAVEYNEAADPNVWVRLQGAENGGSEDRLVTLEIADDGPGLPEMEREVFESDSETPLQHSSGLGLWLARWVIEDLGGEVSIRDREPQGTVVTLRLPRSDGSLD